MSGYFLAPWAVACQVPLSMGLPRILEWVASFFFKWSPWPRDQIPHVLHLQADSLPLSHLYHLRIKWVNSSIQNKTICAVSMKVLRKYLGKFKVANTYKIWGTQWLCPLTWLVPERRDFDVLWVCHTSYSIPLCWRYGGREVRNLSSVVSIRAEISTWVLFSDYCSLLYRALSTSPGEALSP